MGYMDELWPVEGHSFYDINDTNFQVHIKWSKNIKKDYQKLSEVFFECGYKICEKIVDCGHDNIKSDTWFFPSMYLFRQGMELGITALICGAITNKGKIQQVFLSCKHDLYKLFEAYEAETFLAITGEEYNWLKKYLESLEMVDAKSDLFRFPLEDEFLSTYRNEFLDIVDMANSMLQAYGLIQKCLVIPEGDKINRFDRLRSDEFLQFANHGIGNCYLWESITGDGFHKLVLGYGQTAEFLFMEYIGISRDEKIFPILFFIEKSYRIGTEENVL